MSYLCPEPGHCQPDREPLACLRRSGARGRTSASPAMTHVPRWDGPNLIIDALDQDRVVSQEVQALGRCPGVGLERFTRCRLCAEVARSSPRPHVGIPEAGLEGTTAIAALSTPWLVLDEAVTPPSFRTEHR